MNRSRSYAMILSPLGSIVSNRLFCPTFPVNHWGGQAGRIMDGGWCGASQDFPSKRQCALGLSAGPAFPSPAQTRAAQPELDPRDDA